jgi:hypothetical protein
MPPTTFESIQDLIAKAKKEFSVVPHPGSDRITVADCCKDHDTWIEWCGNHSSTQFLEALRGGGFDPVEFGSLYPEAYHYFAGAVAIYCLERLADRADANFDWDQWIDAFCPLRNRADDFTKEYLIRFSGAQRMIIARLLELASEKYFSQEGQQNEDFIWAAGKIWGAA